VYQNSCWSLKYIVTCSNMLYTCKPDKQKLCQISIHFSQGSKQYGDTVHHNHLPVPFFLSAWICFEILFVFSCFWEFLEQQAFLFSDTSLGLNILQTYLSMIEVLFFTGSYTKSSSLLLCLPSDELKSKSCSIST